MNVSPAKENILKRVRNALSQPVPLPFPRAEGNQPVFEPKSPNLEIAFAEAFAALKGRFVFCSNHEELARNLTALSAHEHWNNCYCRDLSLLHQLEAFDLPFLNIEPDIAQADAGLTTCEALVARSGSIVVSAGQPSGRTVSIFPRVHLVVAYINQLVDDIGDAMKLLQKKYGAELPSMISFQSGPSRTSDIEKTSVIGVHGPAEVYVFLVDEDALL